MKAGGVLERAITAPEDDDVLPPAHIPAIKPEDPVTRDQTPMNQPLVTTPAAD